MFSKSPRNMLRLPLTIRLNVAKVVEAPAAPDSSAKATEPSEGETRAVETTAR